MKKKNRNYYFDGKNSELFDKERDEKTKKKIVLF
jgi:hypothetical protein